MTNVWRSLAFGIGGKLVGTRFRETLAEMQRVQWLPAEELRARSEARLATLLKHAAQNVPFYRQTYRRLGLATDALRTKNDLSALPVVTKAFYRSRAPEEFFATDIPAYRRVQKSSSGSTGEPFQFHLDRQAMPIIFASHLFYDSWFGLRPFDKYVRIVSPPAPVPPLGTDAPTLFRIRQRVADRLQKVYESRTQRKISVWEVDGFKARDVWQCIKEFQPDFVMGYTSALAAIADELIKGDLRLPAPIRGVITIAETLSPLRRSLIERYFKAPIINRYGLREFGSWTAQNCHESPDQFHINTELALCEILRDDGSQTTPGEVGRVVLTDLSNYARPFIRYDTGDLALAVEGNCACGRGFPTIGQIQGRSQECLRTPSGKQISSVVLGHYLFVYNDHLEAVSHYQLIQETVNRARLLIVPSNAWNEDRRERIWSDLSHLIGDDMTITVETVNQIPPERSGKRPIIKQAQVDQGSQDPDS